MSTGLGYDIELDFISIGHVTVVASKDDGINWVLRYDGFQFTTSELPATGDIVEWGFARLMKVERRVIGPDPLSQEPGAIKVRLECEVLELGQ